MSNLGLYQDIVRWSKKVGGPKVFIGLVAGSGYLGGKVVELIFKEGADFSKRIVSTIKENKHKNLCDKTIVFDVMSAGKSEDGLEFKIGDQYRVLEVDGQSILIEKLRDSNNPYCVSADFLRSVSNFT